MNSPFDRIEISIDESNIFSKKLFEKMGFVIVSKEDELENYIYVKNMIESSSPYCKLSKYIFFMAIDRSGFERVGGE